MRWNRYIEGDRQGATRNRLWPKVNLNPKNKFKKVENCNYVVTLAKQMKFSMVNIGGLDILAKNKKLILGIIWQVRD